MGQRYLGVTAVAAVLLSMGSWLLGVDAHPVDTNRVDADGPAAAPESQAQRTAVAQVSVAPAVTTTTGPPVATATSVATTTTPSGPDPVAVAFLVDINALRRGLDLPALARDPELDALAQEWVDTMADDDFLRHSDIIYEVVEGPWMAAGENVGYGPSEAEIFAGLEESPGHRANMANGTYTHIGIGTRRVGQVVWTAHLFAG